MSALPHLDADDLRSILIAAHTHAVDTIHDCDETIAWLETPDRLSRRSLMRHYRDSWNKRHEHAKLELDHARATRAKYVALADKLESVFAAEHDQSMKDFAEAFAERWRDAKRTDGGRP